MEERKIRQSGSVDGTGKMKAGLVLPNGIEVLGTQSGTGVLKGEISYDPSDVDSGELGYELEADLMRTERSTGRGDSGGESGKEIVARIWDEMGDGNDLMSNPLEKGVFNRRTDLVEQKKGEEGTVARMWDEMGEGNDLTSNPSGKWVFNRRANSAERNKGGKNKGEDPIEGDIEPYIGSEVGALVGARLGAEIGAVVAMEMNRKAGGNLVLNMGSAIGGRLGEDVGRALGEELGSSGRGDRDKKHSNQQLFLVQDADGKRKVILGQAVI